MHDWGRCGGDNAKRSKERAGHGAGEVVGPDRTGWACGGWVTVGQAELKRMCVRAMRGGSGIGMRGASSECGHMAVRGEDER